MSLMMHFTFSFLGTLGFSIFMNVPRRALLSCGLTGALGWIIYWLLKTNGLGTGFSTFFGAVTIGIFGNFFSKKQRMPVIIFNIPSIVPLVPGYPAYIALKDIMYGNYFEGFQGIVEVITIAGAIAFGFMITSLLEQKVFVHLYKYKNRGERP